MEEPIIVGYKDAAVNHLFTNVSNAREFLEKVKESFLSENEKHFTALSLLGFLIDLTNTLTRLLKAAIANLDLKVDILVIRSDDACNPLKIDIGLGINELRSEYEGYVQLYALLDECVSMLDGCAVPIPSIPKREYTIDPSVEIEERLQKLI